MRRLGTIYALSLLTGISMLGCSTPWIDNHYDVEHYTSCRIDRPFSNSIWNSSDINGNGVLDNNERIEHHVELPKTSSQLSIAEGIVTSNTTTQEENSDASQSPPELSDDSENLSTDINESLTSSPDSLAYDNTTSNNSNTTSNNSETSLDGSGFFVILGDIDGNGIVEDTEVVATAIGYDDLPEFDTSFSSLLVDSHRYLHGVKLVEVLRFSKPDTSVHEEETTQSPSRNFLEVYYGARYFRHRSDFLFNGTIEILGGTSAETTTNDQLAGPTVGVNWVGERSGWLLNTGFAAVLGYGHLGSFQASTFWGNAVPGKVTTSSTAQPSYSTSRQSDESLTGLGELTATASYQLSQSLTFHCGYSAYFFTNWREAENSFDWHFPNFGFVENEGQEHLIDTLHASLELRR